MTRATGRGVRALGWAVIALSILGSSPAQAEEPLSPKAEAAARFEGAERAYEALRFGDALDGYRAAATLDPSARFALPARSRIADLEAHAEGGFAPLATLTAVRRDPRKTHDRAAIEALERAAATFPDGRVRAEAMLVVAEAWWHPLGEPRRAIAPLEAAVADASADRLTRALALTELTTIERELGDLEAARIAVERWPELSPSTRAEVLRLVRRERLRAIAIAILALLGAVGAALVGRAAATRGGLEALRSRAFGPLGVAFALYLGGAAALLVRAHGEGDARPFLWLGIGVLAVLTVARAWAMSSRDQRPAMRVLRAIVCSLGVLAAAFLAVERTNATYLESVGL